MKFQKNAFGCAWRASWLMGALVALPSWAVEPFALKDIRVEGLQRIEPGTVFASLPFRIGDTFTDDKGTAAIRSLFGLGLFADVGLQIEGNVLVITLQERPSVADVTFSGIKEFDAEVLKKALRDIGLAEGRAFDKSLADRAEQELKRQYLNRSMYAAQVVTTVTPAERNRVNLNFSVVEGDVAKIEAIRIVGAQAFSERTLRDLFNLDTGGWLSWYTKANRYSRAKLNADLETLRSYYLSRGFLEFRIDSTQVAISTNKSEMELTVNITEGNRFAVSAVELQGDFLGKDDEFKSMVALRVGQAYNDEDVSQTVKAFTDRSSNRVVSCCKPNPSAGCMCAKSTWRATTKRVTKWFVASFANLKRLGTTETAFYARVTVSTAWAFSRKSPLKPNPCPAPTIKWT